jgi:hypothetical protein
MHWQAQALREAATHRQERSTRPGSPQPRAGNSETRAADTRTDRVDTRTDKVNTRTARVDTRASRVDTQTGKVNTRAGRVDTRTGKINTQAGKVDTQTGKINTQAGKVDTQTGRQPRERGPNGQGGPATASAPAARRGAPDSSPAMVKARPPGARAARQRPSGGQAVRRRWRGGRSSDGQTPRPTAVTSRPQTTASRTDRQSCGPVIRWSSTRTSQRRTRPTQPAPYARPNRSRSPAPRNPRPIPEQTALGDPPDQEPCARIEPPHETAKAGPAAKTQPDRLRPL